MQVQKPISVRHPHLILHLLSVVGVGTLLLLSDQAAAIAAPRYTVVDPPQPSGTDGKVEVLEFYAYGCPYCYRFEPFLENWVKRLPPQVVFHPVPFDVDRGGVALQKLYYTLESLGRLDLHDAVFKAIHDEHRALFTPEAIGNWLATQGVSHARFDAVFNSFGVATKVRRADELARNYDVHSTPTLAIGGRYLTSPAQTHSYQGAIVEAQKLLDKVLGK